MSISNPFIVFSLPRSRSAWVTHFLSYPPKQVGHDTVLYCDHVNEFIELFSSGMDGTCETGVMEGHRLIKSLLPRARFVVLRRPLAEIRQSLAGQGLAGAPGELEARSALLDQIVALPGTLELASACLDNPDYARVLFEFCHQDLEFDIHWWAHCSRFNIQVDMRKQVELLLARQSAMAGLRQEVREMTRELPLWVGMN